MSYTSANMERLPPHERLYRTFTGLTKAEKRAIANATSEKDPPSVEEIQKQNKNAKVCTVRGHGLTIVKYPAAVKQDQKQNTSTLPPGYSRTHLGGFFHS
eukprot:gb/GECG01007162.1/.p1 GENE.gb/GECG01007162.1/~~gb/GECG01007162.1/.p1  ORF type:complete len:100 (+),score=11.89 gb/GECG01007162.1/:1-300(+)